MSDAWSQEEVEAAVADYLHMLTLELSGQLYNKTVHRRALLTRLRGRTEGSIERKHQNISAVLIELGCPYISGYKPLINYQAMLFDVVLARLSNDQLFDLSAKSAAEQPAVMPLEPNIRFEIEAAPVRTILAKQMMARYEVKRTAVKRDYLEREARNRSLGLAGEELVVAFERYRLHQSGKIGLSEKVEHVSKSQGDGLGFDVLSFDTDGRERFIEVKTTAFGKETPFFISNNEAKFSEEFSAQFHLYRLFEFRRQPRMFDLNGKVESWVKLDPVSYLARFV
jgi:hypothetical protein